MARKIGLIILIGVILMVLVYLVNIWITKEKLVYSQTQSASDVEQDVKEVINLFQRLCRGEIRNFSTTLFNNLNSYFMKGWSDFTNWREAAKKLLGEDPSKEVFINVFTYGGRPHYAFTNEDSKNKFCNMIFDSQYFTNPNSILDYLERQASLYWLLEKFEIFGLRHKDSFRGRAARLNNFIREVLNPLQSRNGKLTFYIPLSANIPPSRLFSFTQRIEMRITPTTRAGLDRTWVEKFKLELSKLRFNQEGQNKYIATASNATVVLEWKPATDQYSMSYYVLNFDFNKIGDTQNMKNSLSSLIKEFQNLSNKGESLKQLWEGTTPDNAPINVPKMESIKDNADKVEREYNNVEAEIYKYIEALFTGQTIGGRDINEVIQDLSKNIASTTEAAKEYSDFLITLKPATITVEAREVPIAVLPPKLFGGEHKGTTSLAEITPERIFNEIKSFLFKLAPTLFILLLVVGAIAYLITPVNLQYIQTGSEYIKWAIIGYFLLLVVTGIISAVRVIFGGP
jgi:hypothetical protein